MSPDGFRRLPAFTLHAQFASLELSMLVALERSCLLIASFVCRLSHCMPNSLNAGHLAAVMSADSFRRLTAFTFHAKFASLELSLLVALERSCLLLASVV